MKTHKQGFQRGGPFGSEAARPRAKPEVILFVSNLKKNKKNI